MREVDADLYDFLQNHETTILVENKEIVAFVFVDFRDLYDFVKIVGVDHFDDGGVDVTMLDSYLCIPISDYIEGCGHNLSSYKNCFEDDIWDTYESRIIEMERE